MLHFENMANAIEVFKALSAPARIQILELLYQNKDMNLNDLAQKLGLTNSAISMHIKQLEEAGLIEIRTTSGKRGSMKICRPIHDMLAVNLAPSENEELCYCDDIEIGFFTNYKISPTCGIATVTEIIGELDDPKYFSFPQRYNASILWFANGFIEYTLPNRLKPREELSEFRLSFEIASECPGVCDDYPSDIHFSINEIPLGFWISPGDFGNRRGRFTPDWWGNSLNQFGLLKTLTVNEKGTFIDGSSKISDVTVKDLNINHQTPIIFRFSVPEETPHCGGLTLFGTGFGDYGRPMKLRLSYKTDRE
jgi:predicted transcriptional regulator